MSGVNVADKLGLDSEVRELKFGSSFTSGGRNQQQGSFHSVRYDFTPASVDTSKMATLDVGPNGQVTISMPNVDGNGTTVFKGARKPYAKECVLIIDHETGEVVLEKLTHNIQVKRTREEGGSKKGASLSMPVVPSLPVEAKKTPHPPSTFKMDSKQLSSRERDEPKKPLLPVPSSSQMQHQHPSNANKKGPSNSPKPPPPPPQRQSPNNGPSPGHSVSPPLTLTPPSTGPACDSHRAAKQTQAQQNSLLSLTNFEDLLSMAPMNPPPLTKPKIDKPSPKENIGNAPPVMHHQAKPSAIPAKVNNLNNVSALSESSSGDDSSSSSSSDDDDDSSDDMEDVPDKVPIPQPPEINQAPAVINSNRGRPQAVAPSMPTDLLCDDLQLSESGSDSE